MIASNVTLRVWTDGPKWRAALSHPSFPTIPISLDPSTVMGEYTERYERVACRNPDMDKDQVEAFVLWQWWREMTKESG